MCASKPIITPPHKTGCTLRRCWCFLLKTAINEGADAFITGEMHYHDFFGYEQQIQICSIGHYQSEQFTTEVFKSIIENQCKGVVCHITKINTNPIIYI